MTTEEQPTPGRELPYGVTREEERLRQGWLAAERDAIKREEVLKTQHAKDTVDLRRRIARMERTRSWRMTAWLRRLGQFFGH